jgi:hypothetical protein
MATTSFKRSCLEDAFDIASGGNPPSSLRAVLRASETSANRRLAAGSLASVSQNGRETGFSMHGVGQITPTELTEAWRYLVDMFDDTLLFLQFCCNYGYDAFNLPCGLEEKFNDTAALTVINPPVIVDGTGKWALLCGTFAVAASSVIGGAFTSLSSTDPAVFIYMMQQLKPIVESRVDFRQLRTVWAPAWM